MSNETLASPEGSEADEDVKELESGLIELLYVPDFLLDELQFYFAPSKADIREVYVELTGRSAKNWSSYYSKKGWAFLDGEEGEMEGPFRVKPGSLQLGIQEPGRIFSPKPQFRLTEDGPAYPVVSLDKRRPINPWKPQFIRAVDFIKKYSWPAPLSRSCQLAVWEIEECGEVAGSTSWINAERVLMANDSAELRETLSDLFFTRPEDFPLGSDVYLRVLGNLGDEGFAKLLELSKHPIARKRVVVARTLGDVTLGEAEVGSAEESAEAQQRRIDALLVLVEDEDPYVRSAALRSIGRNGLRDGQDSEGLVEAFLEDEEVSFRVWALQALSERSPAHRKTLLQLVKEDERPLTDLGELGEVIIEADLVDAVPYLINRLKDNRAEISMDAGEVLSKLTGLDFAVGAEDSREARRVHVKAVQKWWEEKKKERREKKSS